MIRLVIISFLRGLSFVRQDLQKSCIVLIKTQYDRKCKRFLLAVLYMWWCLLRRPTRKMCRSDKHGRSHLSGHLRVCHAQTDMSLSAYHRPKYANINSSYRFSTIKWYVIHMGKTYLCSHHAPSWNSRIFLICVLWNLSLTRGNRPDKSKTVVFFCQHRLPDKRSEPNINQPF